MHETLPVVLRASPGVSGAERLYLLPPARRIRPRRQQHGAVIDMRLVFRRIRWLEIKLHPGQSIHIASGSQFNELGLIKQVNEPARPGTVDPDAVLFRWSGTEPLLYCLSSFAFVLLGG